MSRATVLVFSLAIGVTATLSASRAHSQGMGLETLHEHRREGKKVCMVGHFHDGTGGGRSRKLAEAEAIRAWQEFTAWEYGGRWGSYVLASNKSMNCADSGGSWTCSTSARPCRNGK